MRVTFKDGRPDEEHTIAAFRDSERACRALAEDGRLGYFGPEVCQSIILEIRFDVDFSLPATSHLGVPSASTSSRALPKASASACAKKLAIRMSW